MARSPQWNVKGVDDEARAVARDAAAAAGLPIGAWIDRAVKQAAKVDLAVAPEPQGPNAAPAPSPRGPDAEENRAAQVAALPAPRVGPAPQAPPELFPRTPPSRGRGHGARIAIAVGIMTLLTGGALWLLSEQTRTPPVASGLEPSPGPTETAATTLPEAAADAGASGANSEVDALRRAAQTGDARAQYDLGTQYFAGRDLPKDNAQAARWYERAALQGLASAQYNLATMYDRGLGVEQDPTLAFFWYQSAAEQGHARAQHNVAAAYADGNGTNQDLGEAARWFEKAAAAGVPDSQYYLGMMYERGIGVPQDSGRALAIYRLAAGQGHKDASDKVAALAATPPMAALAKVPPLEDFVDAPGEAPVARATVTEIQKLLARLDFDPGPADGVIGKKTVEAIAKYQAMAGMTEDGKPSSMLLDDLREVAGAAKR